MTAIGRVYSCVVYNVGTRICTACEKGQQWSLVAVDARVVSDDALLRVDAEHAVERGDDRLVAALHEVREHLAETPRRLLKVVVRNACEQVVDLVRADVVDDVVHDAVMPVDARQLAAHEVPLVVRVPRHVHLVVVQERDDDAVRREDELRHEVVGEDGEETVRRVAGVEDGGHGGDADQRAEAADGVAGEQRMRQC